MWLSELKFKHVQTIKTRRMAKLKQLYQYLKQLSTSRCNDYHYCMTSFNKPWIQVLHTFKSCWQRVGESRWWESLTVVPAGNFLWSAIPQKQFIITKQKNCMKAGWLWEGTTNLLKPLKTVTEKKIWEKKIWFLEERSQIPW